MLIQEAETRFRFYHVPYLLFWRNMLLNIYNYSVPEIKIENGEYRIIYDEQTKAKIAEVEGKIQNHIIKNYPELEAK